MPRPAGRHTKPAIIPSMRHRTWLTVCKRCRHGVFADQPHRWAMRPLGISHDVCLEVAS